MVYKEYVTSFLFSPMYLGTRSCYLYAMRRNRAPTVVVIRKGKKSCAQKRDRWREKDKNVKFEVKNKAKN